MTRWLLGVSLAVCTLAACGGEPSESADVAVDSSFVDLLADLALADARADRLPASSRVASRESLRAVALGGLGADSAAADGRLRALAADPDRASATYRALDARLSRERHGG